MHTKFTAAEAIAMDNGLQFDDFLFKSPAIWQRFEEPVR
jgi:hypothetical protein